MEERSERSRRKLEDRLTTMSAEIETIITLIESLQNNNKHNQLVSAVEHIKGAARGLRKLLNMKKHEQLPEWEMALAQAKRSLDAQMPDEADRIFARLSLGPPRNQEFR